MAARNAQMNAIGQAFAMQILANAHAWLVCSFTPDLESLRPAMQLQASVCMRCIFRVDSCCDIKMEDNVNIQAGVETTVP